ncbi:MAG: NADPH:quinone reductase [Pseudonocardiales bacterium]|nr:NADPH:quinone reductase [Pseudonocardiales bacterium]
MRAIVVREVGGPEVLRIEDVPEPRPGAGEIAIAVEFIGVNFTDVRNRVGDGLGVVPFTPGVEVSGTVSAIGNGVEAFTVGQRVAAFTRGHAYAEVVTAAEIFTVALPDELAGRPEAAGMLVTVPLAINVVERAARVLAGETVVLHAAAGGVGSIVGQLLRELPGVRLWGTVGDLSKADYARKHGYSEVMNYADFDVQVAALTGGRGVDVVLDPVGGELQARSLEVLAPFGRLVSYSNISRAPQVLPDAEWLRARCIGYVGISNGQLSVRAPEVVRAGLERAVDLVASGAVHIDVTAVLPLKQATQAHQAFEERSAVGKFVLSV